MLRDSPPPEHEGAPSAGATEDRVNKLVSPLPMTKCAGTAPLPGITVTFPRVGL